MTEDTILLERYVTDGDRAALEELFARHYAAVHRTILHMVHNSFDADDLSQATFLQAVRKGDQFRSRGSFRGWLLRIAVNQVRDFRRGRKQRREDQLFDLFQAQGEGADVPETGMRREFEQKLEQALEVLPPNLKDPLVLHYYEGLSFAEVAETLELPKSTVQSRIGSSIRRLRDEFSQRGWVVMLPTFDRLLPPSHGAPSAAALPAGRRALWMFVAASLAILATATAIWWRGGDAPPVARDQGAQAPVRMSSSDIGDAKGAGAQASERQVVPLADGRMIVQGRVVANGTGEALAGARVQLYDFVTQDEHEVTSDEQGRFAFPMTEGRRDAFALVVSREGSGRAILPSVVAGQQAHEVRLVGERMLRGRVVAASGEPMVRYRVQAIRVPDDGVLPLLLGAVPQHLRVDAVQDVDRADGAFSLAGLGRGQVVLVVQVAGEQPWWVGGGEPVRPGEADELAVQLPESQRVTVEVVDKLTGAKVEHATIASLHATTNWMVRVPFVHERTVESGVFAMRAWMSSRSRVRGRAGERTIVTRPGMGRIEVTAAGYAPAIFESGLTSNPWSYQYELERGGSVEGRAVDEAGRPLAGMRIVTLLDEAGSALSVSGADGSFAIRGLSTDREALVASYAPDHSRRVSVAQIVVKDGQRQALTVGGPTRDAAGGAIAGSVRRRGVSVAGAGVSIEGGDVSVDTVTDHTGRFRVDGLPAGTFEVEVDCGASREGVLRSYLARRVVVPRGETIEVDVDFAAAVLGICVDVAGRPVSGVSLEAVKIGSPDAAAAKGRSAADGTFDLQLEDAGAYELRTQRSTDWFARRSPTFRIAAGATTDGVRLEVERDPETAELTMRVRDAATGKPLPTGTYRMKGVAIQGNGRWLPGHPARFAGLRGGRFEVEVHHDAYVDETFAFELLQGQVAQVRDVQLSPASKLVFEWRDRDGERHPSGLVHDDRVVAWGSHPIRSFTDFLKAQAALDGAEAPLRIVRGDMELVLQVRARQFPELDLCIGWMHDWSMPLVNR